MNIRCWCLAAILVATWAFTGAAKADDAPNFVIILCDDLGYADVGCFGSELHRTPEIDRMASEGIRLTSFYVTSGVCTPSRSSLLTGCYPRRVGLHENELGGWVLFPGNRRGLNADEITLAEALRELDYATGIVGKWHLGDQPDFLPTRHGFDFYFGIPYSNDMGETDRPNRPYPPLPLLLGEEVIEEEPDQRYLTRRYTEQAVEFIRKHRDRPFLLYLPHTMPHWPQYSSEEFEGQSANGAWGDAVEEIDWSTGQILDTLAELDLDERTLVIFMSDNGGAVNHGASNGPLRGGKGSTWEGGHRTPFIARWPGSIPSGRTRDDVAVSFDLLPTLVSLAGGTPAEDRTIDGRNVAGLLMDDPQAESPHDAFFYYWRGRLDAVRVGRWKLHLNDKPRGGNQKPPQTVLRLFDLETDLGESSDVAGDHPEVVEELTRWAEVARVELGDSATGQSGTGTRLPGEVDNPVTLTQKRPE